MEKINAIREFNRYYTNILGLVNKNILDKNFSLAEARVLLEISKIDNCTSKILSEILCMDPGYLSRILKQFEKYGLIEKRKLEEDKRSYFLNLTESGKNQLKELDSSSNDQIRDLISHLSEDEQFELVNHMLSIENLLTPNKKIKLEDITIRTDIREGDAGYITYMHGWIYKKERNYNETFEAYVAQSFYEFLLNYDENRDRLWIAEHNNEIVGCIGIVDRGDKAQLRWFLLHPNYRKIGLGKTLMKKALNYCKQGNYKSVYLDTTDDLKEAIAMYTREGFMKISEKENHMWAENVNELEFELNLKNWEE